MDKPRSNPATVGVIAFTSVVLFVVVPGYLILYQPWREVTPRDRPDPAKGMTQSEVEAVRDLTPWDRLDPALLDRLSKGMTQSEAETVLGGPPGDYGNPELKHCGPIRSATAYANLELGGGLAVPVVIKKWFDDRNEFGLAFDANGKLVTWHKVWGVRRDYCPPAGL